MKLGFAMLADAAQATPDGKVSIIGGDFDTIYAANFPALHPALTLVIRLDFEPAEVTREHQLSISMTGPLGGHVISTDPRPFTPKMPERFRTEYLKTYFVIAVNGLVFEQQGKHRIRIVVDGKTAGEVLLYLERIQPPSSASGGIIQP